MCVCGGGGGGGGGLADWHALNLQACFFTLGLKMTNSLSRGGGGGSEVKRV